MERPMDRYINMFVNMFVRRVMSKGINAGFKAAEQAMSPRPGKPGKPARAQARAQEGASEDIRAQTAPSRPWGQAPETGDELVISLEPPARKPALPPTTSVVQPRPKKRAKPPKPSEALQMPAPAKPELRVPETAVPPLLQVEVEAEERQPRSKAEQARQAAREARAAVRP